MIAIPQPVIMPHSLDLLGRDDARVGIISEGFGPAAQHEPAGARHTGQPEFVDEGGGGEHRTLSSAVLVALHAVAECLRAGGQPAIASALLLAMFVYETEEALKYLFPGYKLTWQVIKLYDSKRLMGESTWQQGALACNAQDASSGHRGRVIIPHCMPCRRPPPWRPQPQGQADESARPGDSGATAPYRYCTNTTRCHCTYAALPCQYCSRCDAIPMRTE
jgi:hypothetical protein